MPRRKDLTGQRFGYLTVLRPEPVTSGRSKSLCQCENCGAQKIVENINLQRGYTRSCGCLRNPPHTWCGGVIKATVLAELLGIPTSTVRRWCKNDPELAEKRGGAYYVRLHALATRPGFDTQSAALIADAKWIRVKQLESAPDQTPATVRYLRETKQRFAKRIGWVWYTDVNEWGADELQVFALCVGDALNKAKSE